jgi:translation initiation factor 2 beta subunit (eIF-2beta)/eIF-5
MSCGTGCRDPLHMKKCEKCGAETHVGLTHNCSTGSHSDALGHVNWHYYTCRQCGGPGNAHMVSEQAVLELCDKCYEGRKSK